jgi:membrane carboxypeptidase/penicillin-binding protein
VFKPFVYAAALETGMSPLRPFRDAPQEFTYAKTQKYRPSKLRWRVLDARPPDARRL